MQTKVTKVVCDAEETDGTKAFHMEQAAPAPTARKDLRTAVRRP